MKATLTFFVGCARDSAGFIRRGLCEASTKTCTADVEFYYTKRDILASCTMRISGYDDIYDAVESAFCCSCDGYAVYLIFYDYKYGTIMANTDEGYMKELGTFALSEELPNKNKVVSGKMCLID